MEMDISFKKVTNDICSCNSCGRRNYISQIFKNTDIYDIYELRIGAMNNRICKRCLERIVAYVNEDVSIEE